MLWPWPFLLIYIFQWKTLWLRDTFSPGKSQIHQQGLGKLDHGVSVSHLNCNKWWQRSWLLNDSSGPLLNLHCKYPCKQEPKYFTYFHVIKLIEKHKSNHKRTACGRSPVKDIMVQNFMHLWSSQFKCKCTAMPHSSGHRAYPKEVHNLFIFLPLLCNNN